MFPKFPGINAHAPFRKGVALNIQLISFDTTRKSIISPSPPPICPQLLEIKKGNWKIKVAEGRQKH